MGELLSNKDHVIVYLAAQGRTAKEISESVNIPLPTVKTILEREHIQFEIGHLRHKLFGRDANKRWKDMVPAAQDAVADLLSNPNVTAKPGLKLQAAEIVLDRAFGKPKQSIEHSGSMIREVFDMLNDKPPPKPVLDISVAKDADEPQNQEPTNPIDAWAKKNL